MVALTLRKRQDERDSALSGLNIDLAALLLQHRDAAPLRNGTLLIDSARQERPCQTALINQSPESCRDCLPPERSQTQAGRSD